MTVIYRVFLFEQCGPPKIKTTIMKPINKTGFVALAFTLFVIPQFTYGQDSYIKDRWNIKIGHAKYKTGAVSMGEEVKKSSVMIEGNFGILEWLESGVYIGISKSNEGYGAANDYRYRPIVYYGLNANFHILPLLVDAEDLRVDLYFTGKYGFRSMITPPDYLKNKFYPEYGIGGGLAFYPWKHIGIFAECLYGKFEYGPFSIMGTDGVLRPQKDRIKLRYGLSFKF